MDSSGKAFLGRGWAFPVSIDRDRGSFSTVEYENDIKQSIHLILSTSRGERLMRPDFGCGIHDLVFGVINTALITRIKQAVTEALQRYEARIDIIKVEVDAAGAANGVLHINLDYRIRTTNQPGNFVYPFYFREAF